MTVIEEHKKELQGILHMLYSSVAFSLMAVCVKYAARSLPSLEIVFFRSLLGTLMVAALILSKKTSFWGTLKPILILRGLSGFCALTLYFYAIGRVPLGTAVILNYTSPIFAAVFSACFLKEKPGLFLMGMTFIAFTGVYLLVNTNIVRWDLPVFLGLLSAIFAGIAYVAVRAVRDRENPLTIIFYFTFISMIGSLSFLPFGFRWPNAEAWGWLIGVGIFSLLGQIWLTLSLRQTRTSLVMPFCYVTPFLSFCYGIFLWDEPFSFKSLIGGALIVLAGSLISIYGRSGKNLPASKTSG
ncbi:MAG: EamA family transporter [Candidatus Omnitrophica bacterium]|nr:EamA family transporter [Candidatus Omnitrophota bacterium]